ncbi:hypothetical protein IAI10_10585 [Clostridium sp. 19966]|uniref:hypothetical protein n=1 Tax=Clostridium sp. 19966 TaxID=2768166 RepID=UPI0028DFFB15|nr:hypothetical protein [Clostridium sp. 19966]MDT8717104.1 hypothetical protein [Clostridium sp. 19966]
MGCCCCCRKQVVYQPVMVPQPANNCICSLPTLVILILIILQFSKPCCHHRHEDCDE